MPPNRFDRAEQETSESRERVGQQLRDMQAAVGEADFTWDSEDPADYELLFVPGRLLVDERDVEELDAIFRNRSGDFSGGVPERVGRSDGRDLEGTFTYELPGREGRPPRDILDTLKVIDEISPPEGRDDQRPAATLEHWTHVARNGDGNSCPATEPEETVETTAFPAPVTDESVGKDVEVVVIDTGYVNDEWVDGDPLPPLREYDGHGSFIEGVIKSRAPGVNVRHIPYPVHLASTHSGGVVSEYLLADLLGRALDMSPTPDIINISAGCHRINDRPFEEFWRQWWQRPEALREKVAVIAAAGNDRSSDPFFPAADKFAIGVGSLDKTGNVSYFSNYERSADVYVLGRRHVNRFPRGRYTCRWAPHRDEVREFRTGWAEWSGTSFAAPLFAGLVAARMGQDGTNARQAADALSTAQQENLGPPYGDRYVIPLDSPLY